MQKITVLNYNAGNIQSVKKKLEQIGAEVCITNDPKELLHADKIILPGVGHFSNAMQQLLDLNLIETLKEQVLVKKTPVLGICLGMQLMATHSEEGDVAGLNWVNGKVVRFQMKDTLNFKVPHMGWNTVHIEKQSVLMKNIAENAAFYFVHSYYFQTEEPSVVLNTTEYGHSFVSAFEKDHIFGVQYHPEKSHDVGEQLIRNFIEL